MQLKEQVEGVIKSKLKRVSKRMISNKSLLSAPAGDDDNDISDFRSAQYRSHYDPTDRILDYGGLLHFFELIQAGGPDALKQIEAMLQNDPKLDFFPKGHFSTLANQRNSRDQTALYVAIQNNNTDIAMLLIEHGADIKANSTIDVKDDLKEQESNLEVAARWSVGGILGYLLDRAEWTKEELKNALKVASTKDARNVIRKHMKSSGSGGCRSPMCVVF
jgi:hypothetical protein